MDEFFGASMSSIAVVLGVLFGIAAAVILFIFIRQPILIRMAVRNVPRRKAQTILIVLGLMLATMIISSAFTTGDSVSHSIERIATQDLRNLDQLVRVARDSDVWKGKAVPQQFDQDLFNELRPVLEADPDIDGLLLALVQNVAVVNLKNRQFEVAALLTGLEPSQARSFNPRLLTLDGGTVDIASLGPNELYIDNGGAKELQAGPDDLLSLAIGPGAFENFIVKGVSDGFFFKPVGADVALMLPLVRAQELTGKQGLISSILVSNRGGVQDGVKLTPQVQARLKDLPVLRDNGLELFPLKTELIGLANEVASIFVTVFTFFGLFSIGVGILLIFLMFSMLAAERKTEMGISRAVGMPRRHLIQMFMAEGAVYTVVAALIGVLAGVGIGFLLVLGVSDAFSQGAPDDAFTLSPHVALRSILVSFSLGCVVTFVTVAIASWRTSRLNIVRAIRDIPEPQRHRTGVGSLIWGLLLLLLGVLFLANGYAIANSTLFGLGVSIVPLGLALVLRYFGVSQRVVLSAVGLWLLLFWLLPPAVLDAIRDDWKEDFSIFFITGFLVVTGAVLVVVNNSQALTVVSNWAIGRYRNWAPMVKSAVSYPLQSRLRTGLSVAMFAIVIFSIIVMSVLTASFDRLFDDQQRIAGGYQVVASRGGGLGTRSNILNPVQDPAAMATANPDLAFVRRVEGRPSLGSLRTIFDAEARFPQEADTDFKEVFITGADDSFIETNRFGIKLATAQFKKGGGFDAPAVWQALRDNPGLAVINATLVPTRDNFNFEGRGDTFVMDTPGLYLQNDVMEPAPVTLRDLKSGRNFQVTVIGVIDDVASFPGFFLPLSIFTSTHTLAQALPETPQVNSVFFNVDNGTPDAARRIEAAFFSHGLETVDIQKAIDDSQAANRSFNNLLTGFMALGLVVGIAALGVIAARAVVERRHQIGVLRAIGFSRGMVQATFLLESSFIGILGITLGVLLGFLVSLNVAADIRSEEPNFSLVIPWARFAIIAVAAYLFTWLTTYLPSRQAARVAPADALRYE